MMQHFETGDGCQIAYRLDGPADAPLLVLSNSLGTDMEMWAPQMPALTAEFRVLRYDTRGHGASVAPAGSYSLDRLGRDVVELLDASSVGEVAFCGLSLGGMTGQWLGIREPGRISKLILANTSSYMGPAEPWDIRIDTVRKEGMAPVADASIERWFTRPFLRSNPAEIAIMRAMLLATPSRGYMGCCAAIRDMDMRRTVSLIDRPTLVIAGIKDPATPLAHSDALVAAIKGATMDLLDAAHLSNVEQPTAFTASILRFLRS
jgi:3-oxoadipate enol-lactonase